MQGTESLNSYELQYIIIYSESGVCVCVGVWVGGWVGGCVVVVVVVVVCVMLDPIKFIKQPNKRFSIKRKIQSRRRCQC